MTETPKLREHSDLSSLLSWKLRTRDAGDVEKTAEAIAEGRFTFLSETRTLPFPIDWRLEKRPSAPHLWRFHLHYHEFLIDLLACEHTADARWSDLAWRIVDDWIDNNSLSDPRVLDDAFHPYCISLRLPIWILLWEACPKQEMSDRFLRSVVSQARFLRDHLERDIGGNHLLENAKALAIVAAFLDGPESNRWLQCAASVFRKELRKQILPHGEHFERSPMYHALMLETILDTCQATQTVAPTLSEMCGEAAGAMATFLEAIAHPDGDIPLFGDSCLRQATAVAELIERSDRLSVVSEPATSSEEDSSDVNASNGAADATARTDAAAEADSRNRTDASPVRIPGDTWVFRDEEDFFLFDAGPVGPDHLPAHAHADLLGFEASVHGQRLFVDSGVFSYQDDSMRQYCRSSAAHNVLMVDDTDQCDMWSRFRMGYRGWPHGFTDGETHDFYWARALHNAYRRCRVPQVGRWVACRPGGPWFCVDWAKATGSHKLVHSLHVHPSFQTELATPHTVSFRRGDLTVTLQFLTPGDVEVDAGWYCPDFGQRVRCPVVRQTSVTGLPALSAWLLTWDGSDGKASLSTWQGDQTCLTWSDGTASTRLYPVPKG